MDISFEYYKIFYYVAKYENITKAAMVLKSSQPNVTRIIHILEDQLDCRLFLREPRGLKLTEEGKRFATRRELVQKTRIVAAQRSFGPAVAVY